MNMTGHTPCLRADNYLHTLIAMIDVEVVITKFLKNLKLIASIHENVLFIVEEAQKKQGKTYATKKGKQTFEGLVT